VATLTQIQVKDEYTPAEYGTNAQPNTLQFRSIFAVRPHLITPLEQLVRPTIQVVTVPRNKTASTTTAFDDFQLLDLFVIPFPDVKTTGFRWGLGTYWVFPTSTSDVTGSGAWQLGPAWGFSWQGRKAQGRCSIPAVHFLRIHVFALEVGRTTANPTHPEL
jgi:hypothetical protein